MNTTIPSCARDIENGHLTINGTKYEANTTYAISDAPLKSQDHSKARISFAFGFSSLGGFERVAFFKIEFISLETAANGFLSGGMTKSIVAECCPEDAFREISSTVTQTDRTPQKQDGSIIATLKNCLETQLLSIHDFQHFFTNQ